MTYDPYVTEEIFFVATKVCLKYENSILVIEESRPGKSLWMELPGGKISKKDQDLDVYGSLRREVAEELHIDLDFNESNTRLLMALKNYEDVTFSDSIVPFIFLCYVYEISDKPDIILSHEHSSYRWIEEHEIDEFAHWRPGFDTIIKKAFKKLT